MQENNFEKQVQQKTDELKLKPSEEVWQKVALAIAERKDDRRVFIPFFLILLSICCFIFIIWERPSHLKMNTAISKSSHADKSGLVNEQTAKNIQQSISPRNKEKPAYKNIAGNQSIVTTDTGMKKDAVNRQRNIPLRLPAKAIISITGARPEYDNDVDPKGILPDVYNNTEKPGFSAVNKPGAPANNDNPAYPVNQVVGLLVMGNKTVETPPILEKQVRGKERVPGTVSEDILNTKDPVNDPTDGGKETKPGAMTQKTSLPSRHQDGWKIGLNFSIGLIATQNGYLGIIGSGSDRESKALANPNQPINSNIGQGLGTTASYHPSKIKAGTGLILGVFAQKNISRATSLLIGVNYKHYTSSMLIGNPVSSSPNYSMDDLFYSSGNAGRYNNHFHFIELPVAAGFNLNKRNKWPVYLNTGVSIGRLVSSNALQFDTLSGYYHNNNTVFNKIQLNLSVSLLFSLPLHAKNPFLIGPDVDLGLKKMANSGLYKSRHYSYFGIGIQKGIGTE